MQRFIKTKTHQPNATTFKSQEKRQELHRLFDIGAVPPAVVQRPQKDNGPYVLVAVVERSSDVMPWTSGVLKLIYWSTISLVFPCFAETGVHRYVSRPYCFLDVCK